MTQIPRKKLSPKAEEDIQKTFYKLVSDLATEENLKIFFNAFLSKTERIMLAKRFLVLYLLKKGSNIQEITDSLNITPATIVKLNLKRKLHSRDFSLAFKKMDQKVLKESLKELAKTLGLKVATRIAKGGRI